MIPCYVLDDSAVQNLPIFAGAHVHFEKTRNCIPGVSHGPTSLISFNSSIWSKWCFLKVIDIAYSRWICVRMLPYSRFFCHFCLCTTTFFSFLDVTSALLTAACSLLLIGGQRPISLAFSYYLTMFSLFCSGRFVSTHLPKNFIAGIEFIQNRLL